MCICRYATMYVCIQMYTFCVTVTWNMGHGCQVSACPKVSRMVNYKHGYRNSTMCMCMSIYICTCLILLVPYLDE